MNFCVNCTHFKPPASCCRDTADYTDLVTGSPTKNILDCYKERLLDYTGLLKVCGKEGRFFVQHEENTYDYNGVLLVAVESDDCKNCYFNTGAQHCLDRVPSCYRYARRDNRNIVWRPKDEVL